VRKRRQERIGERKGEKKEQSREEKNRRKYAMGCSIEGDTANDKNTTIYNKCAPQSLSDQSESAAPSTSCASSTPCATELSKI
jgi:hypothetical protein